MDLESNLLEHSLLSKHEKNNQTMTTMSDPIESINQSPGKDQAKLLENPEEEASPGLSSPEDEPHIYDLPNVEGVTKRVMCKLFTVSIVCTVLMIAECIGGLLAGSLAIMTDAAHLFSDLSGFFISIFSVAWEATLHHEPFLWVP